MRKHKLARDRTSRTYVSTRTYSACYVAMASMLVEKYVLANKRGEGEGRLVLALCYFKTHVRVAVENVVVACPVLRAVAVVRCARAGCDPRIIARSTMDSLFCEATSVDAAASSSGASVGGGVGGVGVGGGGDRRHRRRRRRGAAAPAHAAARTVADSPAAAERAASLARR